jgi:hypothetical protein
LPSRPKARPGRPVSTVDDQNIITLYSAPRTCVFHRADTGLYGHTLDEVTGMRWDHWGAATTSASGTFLGNMHFRASASVQLSGLQPCGAFAGMVYTRFAIQIQGAGNGTMRLDDDC